MLSPWCLDLLDDLKLRQEADDDEGEKEESATVEPMMVVFPDQEGGEWGGGAGSRSNHGSGHDDCATPLAPVTMSIKQDFEEHPSQATIGELEPAIAKVRGHLRGPVPAKIIDDVVDEILSLVNQAEMLPNVGVHTLFQSLGLSTTKDSALLSRLCITMGRIEVTTEACKALIEEVLFPYVAGLTAPAPRVFNTGLAELATKRTMLFIESLAIPVLSQPVDRLGSAQAQLFISLVKEEAISKVRQNR